MADKNYLKNRCSELEAKNTLLAEENASLKRTLTHKNCMLEGAALAIQTARVTRPVADVQDIQWLLDLANDTGPLPVVAPGGEDPHLKDEEMMLYFDENVMPAFEEISDPSSVDGADEVPSDGSVNIGEGGAGVNSSSGVGQGGGTSVVTFGEERVVDDTKRVLGWIMRKVGFKGGVKEASEALLRPGILSGLTGFPCEALEDAYCAWRVESRTAGLTAAVVMLPVVMALSNTLAKEFGSDYHWIMYDPPPQEAATQVVRTINIIGFIVLVFLILFLSWRHPLLVLKHRWQHSHAMIWITVMGNLSQLCPIIDSFYGHKTFTDEPCYMLLKISIRHLGAAIALNPPPILLFGFELILLGMMAVSPVFMDKFWAGWPTLLPIILGVQMGPGILEYLFRKQFLQTLQCTEEYMEDSEEPSDAEWLKSEAEPGTWWTCVIGSLACVKRMDATLLVIFVAWTFFLRPFPIVSGIMGCVGVGLCVLARVYASYYVSELDAA